MTLGLLAMTAVASAADRASTPSVFAPVSTPAFAIREVAFFVLGITGVIFVVVGGLTAYAIVRYRRRDRGPVAEPPQVYGATQIELAWKQVPLLIVVVLLLVMVHVLLGSQRV